MAPKNKKKKDQQAAAAPPKATKKWREHADLIPLLPLAFILLVIPLIVYAKMPSPESAAWMVEPADTIRFELSAYYKGIGFLIAAFLSLLIVLGKKLKGDLQIQNTPMVYPLIVFLVMAVISSLMSDYRPVALTGYHGRYEGLYLLLGYGAVFYAATQLVSTKKQFDFQLAALWASAVIMAPIGLLQAAGLNPFLTDIGQRLILPSDLHQFIGEFTGAGGSREVFLTMGNSNYAGGYMAMVLSVFVSLMFLLPDRRIKALLFVSNALMLTVLIFTGSRAGYLGFLAAMVVLVIMLHKEIRHKAAIAAALVGLIIAANFIVGLYTTRTFFDGVRTVFDDITMEPDLYPTGLMDLEITNHQIIWVGTGETFIINQDQSETLSYQGDNNRPLNWETSVVSDPDAAEAEVHHIITPGYEHYRVTWETHDQGSLVKINNGLVEGDFFRYEDRFFIIGHQGELVEYEPVESIGFEGRESIGTYRGYIWSRSIPLLKETLLIGHGPDTFVYYFPQNDYLAVLQQKVLPNVITDKPHSYYLQTAISTGMISFVALMAFFGIYLAKSVGTYFREDPTPWHNQYGISILSGSTAYLFTGLFNDSIIGTSAVFWVMLGLGASLLLSRHSNAGD